MIPAVFIIQPDYKTPELPPSLSAFYTDAIVFRPDWL